MQEKSEEQKQKDEAIIVKEITTLGFAGYLGQIISAGRGFIIAGFLGPSLYGIWCIVKMLIYLAENVSLGTTSAMTREVPFNRGKGQVDENVLIVQSTLYFGLLLSCFVAGCVFLWTVTPWVTSYHNEIRLATLAFIGTFLLCFIRALLKAENKIILLSRFNLAFALLNTVISLMLLFSYKINGLIMGCILTELVLFVYLGIKKHLSFSFHFDLKVLLRLLTIGFPIMLLSVSTYLMLRIDNLIVFLLLGSTKMGFYGLASFITVTILYIPQSISTALMPKMMHKYGRTNRKEDLEEYLIRPIHILTVSMPVILGFIFINIDVPIIYLLPKYIPSITAIQILSLSLFFTVLMSIPQSILIAFDKQRKLLIMLVLGLIVGACLDYGSIKMGYGIVGVAYATSFTFFLISFSFILYALFIFQKSLKDTLWIVAKTYFPLVYAIMILGILGYGVHYEDNLFVQDLLRSLLFLIATFPLWMGVLKIVRVKGAVYKKEGDTADG